MGYKYLEYFLRMNIQENLFKIKSELSSHVKLIAVSKTKPVKVLLEAYHAGQKVFGENRVQELVQKYEALPKDIEWHFIGHLQTNKVKYIAPFVHLIHSVDSLTLLKEIHKEAIKNNRSIDCLLQLHIAKEETKFGLSFEEAEQLLNSEEVKQLKNICIAGLMGMATLTDDEMLIRKEFHALATFFTNHQSLITNPQFLSMGMSSDYKIAVEEGSNMVRVGSSIFGER